MNLTCYHFFIRETKVSCVLSQVLEIQEETAIGSDSESVLSWTPSQPVQKSDVTASGKKCLSAIFTEVLDSPARSIIKP